MSHHQVIAAALEMNGDNAYLRTKGGLDFGIRTTFFRNRENSGVDRVETSEVYHLDTQDTPQQQKELKHKIPDILDCKKGFLTDEEIDFFRENLDYEKLSENDSIMEYWQTLFDEE